jgi:hypothetical protein
LIGVSSNGPGLFVQCGLPDRETKRVFNVDERLAVLERDWILIVRIVLLDGMAIGSIRRRCRPFPQYIAYFLRFQGLLGILFVIVAELAAVTFALPHARTCGGGAYSRASRVGP